MIIKIMIMIMMTTIIIITIMIIIIITIIIIVRYSGNAYCFQCGMQLLIWSEKWSHYLWVG